MVLKTQQKENTDKLHSIQIKTVQTLATTSAPNAIEISIIKYLSSNISGTLIKSEKASDKKHFKKRKVTQVTVQIRWQPTLLVIRGAAHETQYKVHAYRAQSPAFNP